MRQDETFGTAQNAEQRLRLRNTRSPNSDSSEEDEPKRVMKTSDILTDNVEDPSNNSSPAAMKGAISSIN